MSFSIYTYTYMYWFFIHWCKRRTFSIHPVYIHSVIVNNKIIFQLVIWLSSSLHRSFHVSLHRIFQYTNIEHIRTIIPNSESKYYFYSYYVYNHSGKKRKRNHLTSVACRWMKWEASFIQNNKNKIIEIYLVKFDLKLIAGNPAGLVEWFRICSGYVYYMWMWIVDGKRLWLNESRVKNASQNTKVSDNLNLISEHRIFNSNNILCKQEKSRLRGKGNTSNSNNWDYKKFCKRIKPLPILKNGQVKLLFNIMGKW